ncbi:FtsX-like permease family protein [Glycomyces sp. NRRL B-16210]|uniref:FtsX-like permease family protein n=1 Tax=Glycomyces sp. NRRL B-16210 TaxID=1463821 RepID=UPI0004BE4E6A|nr:FtsX-like permease family protein [Glycomyces sp. NRRL B-16210]
MLLLAWNTFRDRWQVFAGAIVTVCLGVALVQSSLLTLVAASTAPVPPGLSREEELALSNGYGLAITLLGMLLALATFVAVFIVSSTFAFAVAQRRRELALLRMTGASRGQVRSLLVGEAVLLGLVGSVLGVVLGLPVMVLQVRLLVELDFAPPAFEAQWRWWAVPASVGAGVLIAVVGVLAASRQASRVRPLEALRESGRAARVMTGSRWVLGLLFVACGVVLLVLLPAGDTGLPVWFVQITPFLVSVPLVVGFAALAPLIVPLVGRVFGLFFRGPLGELAMSNLRFDARRSAATAAPIMVLVAFVASIGGTLSAVSEAARQETLRAVEGDFVVTADGPVGAELAAVDGVAVVSQETTMLFELSFEDGYGGQWWETHAAVAADPEAYAATRDVEATAGNLASLGGSAIAVSPDAWERDWRVGDTLRVRLGGAEREVTVAALLPASVAGPYFVFSPDAVPPDTGPWRHLVRLADGADEDAVAAALGGFGTVQTVGEWVGATAAAEERATLDVMIVLLGMTMLYTVIAMVNAVVIAASDRRREFAAARVTGLGRGQVVRVAFWESQAVVLIGLLLGGLAAAGSYVGVALAIRNLIGITVVSVQWPLLVALALGAAVVVGGTNVVTTLSATRTPPIRLVASRE